MIMTYLWVAVGGALDSMARFWLGHAVATASLATPEQDSGVTASGAVGGSQ